MTDVNLLLDPLPADWENCLFGDVCDRVKDSYKPVEDGETLYVGLEHLAQGFPAFVGRGVESDIKSSKTAFKVGDILFGKLRPYLRKGVQASFDGICSTDILAFRAADRCESNFLKYLVHSDPFINHAKSTTSGVQHPRTSWPSLKEFHLSLPPLPEQKKIAHILSTVQRAIEAQERIIQTTTVLKKTLMQKLFTEGLRNEPQKQTEIGPVPESWEDSTLGDIAKFRTGGTPSRKKKEFWEGGTFPWVKTGEINYETIVKTGESITEAGLKGSNTKLLPKGTLLIAMYGQGITRGRVGLLGIEAATNQACAAVMPHNQDQIKTAYIYFYLEYFYEELRSRGHGANQKNLSMTLLKMFPVAFPDIDTQQEFIGTLTILDRKVALAKRCAASYKDLFRTLLHELMTAKIHVNNIFPSIM